jgi:hypothetical protein
LTDGQSCHIHEACLEYVEEGNLLRIVPMEVTINGKTQEAVKLVRLLQGADGFTVALILRMLMNLPQVKQNNTNFAQVKDGMC